MSVAQPANVTPINKKAALQELYDTLHKKNMFPFWATTEGVEHDEIKQLMATSKAIPFVWSYADIEPLLQRAAELVTMSDSERRSLILLNPGLAPKRASVSTMYTAYRLNDPDEIMPPHKHSPSAVRFGLTGKGNFTGVEGEDVVHPRAQGAELQRGEQLVDGGSVSGAANQVGRAQLKLDLSVQLGEQPVGLHLLQMRAQRRHGPGGVAFHRTAADAHRRGDLGLGKVRVVP